MMKNHEKNNILLSIMKEKTDFSNVSEVALVEVKKENWFIRFIKRLLFKLK